MFEEDPQEFIRRDIEGTGKSVLGFPGAESLLDLQRIAKRGGRLLQILPGLSWNVLKPQ